MIMKTEIMEIIAEYASNNYESQILQSEEYAELVNNIVELQEDIKRLNLPEEQYTFYILFKISDVKSA